MSYDLRRLRLHGLIERLPRTHRYQVTRHGMATAVLLLRVHDRLLRPGLAQLTDPDPPAPTPLRTALNRLNDEIDRHAQRSGLAA